ncbi:hypothetical protein TNCV_5051421 [Trichonephila clavipes]|nr:hypothetical protein TNCV_5051421 [Trichonephila clavipes]
MDSVVKSRVQVLKPLKIHRVNKLMYVKSVVAPSPPETTGLHPPPSSLQKGLRAGHDPDNVTLGHWINGTLFSSLMSQDSVNIDSRRVRIWRERGTR